MEQDKTIRKYTAEFRADAVALVASSGRAVTEVAKELGVPKSSLGAWVRDAAATKDESELETDANLKVMRKRIRELEEET